MSTQYPQVTIPNTEVRGVSSSNVGQEFKIFVALPRSYADLDKTYPVLYVLDANGTFGMFTETIRMLQFGEELPEMIIVGIAYPVNGFVETLGLRARDYTPTVDSEWFDEYVESRPDMVKSGGTGGAGNFLKFLREELMPFIQSNYRIDPEDKAIAGASFGGLFALYALFHYPDTFNRYIIGSPSIWWDEAVTFTYESEFAASNVDLSAKVFMSVGALEAEDMIAPMQKLARTLQDRGYDSLELKTRIFEDEAHMSACLAGVSTGLRAVCG
jgi:hypothetical protein